MYHNDYYQDVKGHKRRAESSTGNAIAVTGYQARRKNVRDAINLLEQVVRDKNGNQNVLLLSGDPRNRNSNLVIALFQGPVWTIADGESRRIQGGNNATVKTSITIPARTLRYVLYNFDKLSRHENAAAIKALFVKSRKKPLVSATVVPS